MSLAAARASRSARRIRTSTAWGMATAKAMADSESLAQALQRSREFLAEPDELQQLPASAMIVSYAGPGGRQVVLADANPGIGGLSAATRLTLEEFRARPVQPGIRRRIRPIRPHRRPADGGVPPPDTPAPPPVGGPPPTSGRRRGAWTGAADAPRYTPRFCADSGGVSDSNLIFTQGDHRCRRRGRRPGRAQLGPDAMARAGPGRSGGPRPPRRGARRRHGHRHHGPAGRTGDGQPARTGARISGPGPRRPAGRAVRGGVRPRRAGGRGTAGGAAARLRGLRLGHAHRRGPSRRGQPARGPRLPPAQAGHRGRGQGPGYDPGMQADVRGFLEARLDALWTGRRPFPRRAATRPTWPGCSAGTCW